MTIHKERLIDAIKQIASEEIIRHLEFSSHDFGVVSITDVIISKDGSYSDIFLSSTEDIEKLPKFLTTLSGPIHMRISRELALRKTPKIRFRKIKDLHRPTDILSLINILDKQYGLSEEHHTAHSS